MFSNEYDEIVEYYLEVARGNIINAKAIHKFGLANDVDPGDGQVDVWDGMSNDIGGKVSPYNFWDGLMDLQVSSSDAADTDVIIEVTGLDASGIEQARTTMLNGNTPVLIPGNWTAVNTARTVAPQPSRGNLFISDLGTTTTNGRPDDDTTIRAIVQAAKQRTQMAVYTVPSDTTLYITHGWCHISKASTTEALIEIYTEQPGYNMEVVHTIGLSSIGASGDHRPYKVPLAFQPGSKLLYRAQALSNNTAISAGFHGVLIKEK